MGFHVYKICIPVADRGNRALEVPQWIMVDFDSWDHMKLET